MNGKFWGTNLGHGSSAAMLAVTAAGPSILDLRGSLSRTVEFFFCACSPFT